MEPVTPNEEADQSLSGLGSGSIAQHAATIRKRWRLVLMVMLMVCGGVFIWTFRAPKYYGATCSIIIDPQAPKVMNGSTDVVELGTGNYWATQEFYETQYKIMMSKDLALRVIERLGLVNDPDFPNPGDGTNVKRQAKDLIAPFLEELKVSSVKQSRIANVTVQDRSPERAAQIANAVAAAYMEGNLDYKLEGSTAANAFLDDQVVTLRQKLERSEHELFAYREKNKLLEVGLDARQSMNTQNVQSYTGKLADLRAKKIEIESSRKLILAAMNNIEEQESLPEVRENPVVQQLRVIHFDLTKTLAELETTYGEQHPRVLSLKRKIASNQQAYVGEIGKIMKEKENAYRAIEENERALNRLLDKEKHEAIELAKLELDYRPMARDAEENNNFYKMIMLRAKDVGLSAQIKSNNVRRLDAAVPNKRPVKPRIFINLAIALVFGVVLGFAAALGAEGLDNTVKSQEQAEAVLGVPVLGMIPMVGEKGNRKLSPAEQKDRDLSVHRDSKSSAAEACRSIRTNLLFLSPEKPLKSLVVTSPGPQEGKTTTAINLAITMAQSGAKVLLIDTDLRRPRVHRAFGLTNEAGISNIIVGDSTLDQMVIHSEVENLDVLPCGPLPPNPAELLHTQRFSDIMKECARRYDRVIYDSPPTSAVTDPVIIGNLADGVVLVIRAGHTTREAAGYARRQLSDAKAKVLGAIVNRVDPSDRYYNYYYSRYYRSYRYGSYSSTPSSSS